MGYFIYFYLFMTYSKENISFRSTPMDFRQDKNLLNDAINAGCKTAAQLALFLKLHAKLAH